MDLQSLGHAAATYQRSPKEIAVAVGAVQAERAFAEGRPIPHEAVAALTLNGLRYFDVDEIAAAISWLAAHDAERRRLEAVQNAD